MTSFEKSLKKHITTALRTFMRYHGKETIDRALADLQQDALNQLTERIVNMTTLVDLKHDANKITVVITDDYVKNKKRFKK